jgi:hypothetical protein
LPAARTHHVVGCHHPAAEPVGGDRRDDRPAEHHGEGVRRPGHGEQAERRPQAGDDRKAGEGRAPDGDRDEHGPALAYQVADRPGERGADQAADADGGSEQAKRARVTAEPLGVDGREQGHRQGEDRGGQIGKERPADHLAAADETDPLRDRARARPRAAARRPHRGQPGDPVQRGGEADRVGQIASAQAQMRRGGDEPGEGGADGQHDLEAEPVQRQPGG